MREQGLLYPSTLSSHNILGKDIRIYRQIFLSACVVLCLVYKSIYKSNT